MIRLAFVGPMVGDNDKPLSTQGDIVAKLFAKQGYPVVAVSALPNRYARLVEIAGTLIRRRREIDLQCVQVYSGPSFVLADLASWLGKIAGHRVVMFLHGGALPKFATRHSRWVRRVLNRADRIIAPSEFLATAFKPYGYQVEVIPNVIDLSDYPYRHRGAIGPRLLWMRAFDEVYNPRMAIHALASLRSVTPEATLVMAGQDKGAEGQVRQLTNQLGLSTAVRFPGFLDRDGKAREGTEADIFLNTSHVDNMPVSVVEACAMGLPVISTAVGGVPSLLKDGESGLLVAANDAQAMSHAARRLLNDPALAAKLSTNGRLLAESSSWSKVLPKWEQMFDRVMA